MKMEIDDLSCTIDTLNKQRGLMEKTNRTLDETSTDIQDKYEKSERAVADASALNSRQLCEINELKRLVEEKEAMNAQLVRQKNSGNVQIEELKRSVEEETKGSDFFLSFQHFLSKF